MIKQLQWADIYQSWKNLGYYFPNSLISPMDVEIIPIKYNQQGYIWGYDWIDKDEVQTRKQQIAPNPIEFLYLTKPTNKGTIHTAEMLLAAKDEEERAAIWIAATAYELKHNRHMHDLSLFAEMLYLAAWSLLDQRFYMWHHAMRKLVPDILIPWTILHNTDCHDLETVIGLIQMNTLMLKGTHSILCYTSLPEGVSPDCRPIRTGI